MAERPSGTHLVVDGSNIATEGRSLPSLKQLDEAVRALIEERPHDTWTVVVDATFGHRIDSSEKQMYEEALAANELVTPPAGTIGRGDKFLLEIADRANATVFSNDSFQEFHGEYEWLFDEGRLIGGKPVPEVGWIFTARTPVRGPKSRMSTRSASERRGRASGARGGRRVLSATEPLPVPSKPPPRTSRRRPVSAASVADSTPGTTEPDADADADEGRARSSSRSGRTPRGRRSSTPSVEAVNEPLPFIEFIAENGPGSVVKGEVTTFTSHGAFVQVGDVRCYLALKLMGDPPPRSARDVLNRGEVYDFVVHALDAPRRGIDLAMPAVAEVATKAPEAIDELPAEQPRRARRTRVSPPAGGKPEAAEVPVAEQEVPRRRRARKSAPEAPSPEEGPEAQVQSPEETAPEEAAPKKAATKRAASKKATTKKAAAEKVPAKKAGTKKVAAKKAGTKKAAPKKATTKKAAAKKVAPKKAATKKATTKKAAAKKAATKKVATNNEPVKKPPTRKRAVAPHSQAPSDVAEGEGPA